MTEAWPAAALPGVPEPSREPGDQVPEYVESLRHISISLSSGMDLRDVLQVIVDAICDHTLWKLSWIYAMDTDGGYGEIVARRDRMDYTKQSPKQRWPFGGNPALDALRHNEVIAVPDARVAKEYPELREYAMSRGVVASANLPLSSTDPRGRPMVLCVQSRHPLLEDPTQIPFLKAVASLASLAATNAGLLAEARHVATRASETAQLLSSTMDSISTGASSRSVLAHIETTTARSIVVFDSSGHLFSTGRVPPELDLDQDQWEAAVLEHRDQLYRSTNELLEPHRHSAVPIELDVLGGPVLSGFVTRFGQDERSTSTVITIGWAGDGSATRHNSAGTATAMVLLRERLALEAQSMLQRDVLVQMLEGVVDDRYEFAARAAYAGIEIDQPNYLVVVRRTAAVERLSRTPRLSTVLKAHLLRWPGGVMQSIAGVYVMVLPSTRARSDELAAFVETLAAVMQDGEPAFLVTHTVDPITLEKFPREWQRCRQTIELAEKVDRTGLVGVRDFGAYRVLLAALQGEDIAEFIHTTIGPLLDADRDRHSELFDTAESFANSSGKFQETARRLHIHVSTLRYRLQRIAALLGKDLADEEIRFEVSLATRLERLRRGR